MQTVAMRIEGRDSCGVFANVAPPGLRVIEDVSRTDCLIDRDRRRCSRWKRVRTRFVEGVVVILSVSALAYLPRPRRVVLEER
jgi:hypothetical protein